MRLLLMNLNYLIPIGHWLLNDKAKLKMLLLTLWKIWGPAVVKGLVADLDSNMSSRLSYDKHWNQVNRAAQSRTKRKY